MKIAIKIESSKLKARLPTAKGKRIILAKAVKVRRDVVGRKARHKRKENES